jgi:molybdate transport system substrate-binding protein
MIKNYLRHCAAALLMIAAPLTQADDVNVAVAANFTAAIKQLTPIFEQKTGHKLLASFGATGALYAQINNGAPFDVLLAADTETPQKLVQAGTADSATYVVYAIGQLALWSATPGYVGELEPTLKRDFTKIAIANPKTAPYGAAAIETLDALKLRTALEPKFVTGENIAQTQQFVSSGNVALGFVALAQVLALPASDRGSYVIVPEKLHTRIDQGAVALKQAAHKQAAADWLAFLKSPEAVTTIRKLGYAVVE